MARADIEPTSAKISLDFPRLAAIVAQAKERRYSERQLWQKQSDFRAGGLALAAHLLLAIFLMLGIRWQSTTPAVIQAELWAPTLQQASPTALPAPSPAAPASAPVAPKSVPPPAPSIPKDSADIALEKQTRKLQAQKAAEQELRKQEKMRLAKQEAAEKEKLEEAVKKEKAQKAEKERLAQAKAEADKRFEQNRQRLIASATTATLNSSGKDLTTATPKGLVQWQGFVRACVQPNVNFPVDSINGNPASDFAIERLPDGSIASVKVTRSGGNPGFDAAVIRAIYACGASTNGFPQPPGGQRLFELIYRPKEQ